MTGKANINCMLLCGGKGTRMQSETKHKVCFEIDGTPAILHTLGNLEKAGIGRFIVVVGALSGQVMECVGSRYPDTAFAFQKEQKGTGNAAKAGFRYMEKFNIEGPVIITMGDKITSPAFIERAVKKFNDTGADLLVCTQPRAVNPTGGRIVLDENGRPAGNREELDTKKALLYKELLKLLEQGVSKAETLEKIESCAENLISSSKKRELVLTELRALDFEDIDSLKTAVRNRAEIKIGDKAFEPEYVDNSKDTNASFYIMSGRAAKYALPLIGDNNAQKEEYLTDIIEILASQGRFRLELESVRDEYEIMSFNNAEELLAIEDYYLRKKQGAAAELDSALCKPVSEWIGLFGNRGGALSACLAEIYGEDESLLAERRTAYLKVLHLFAEKYGAGRKAVISRAPGRINIMGRHIDHRGGYVNVMSINKEVIVIAAVREDDRVSIINTEDDFAPRDFSISEHLIELNWDSWLGYLGSGEIEKLINNEKGDWVNYVKAPLLRFQYQFMDRKLKGMDMAFTGNIPMAAGLSSSSAIVVSTAEALCVLNGLDLTPQRFVELCGEGEWYVGSRGGAADHAAMKFAHRGQVVKLGFLPFKFEAVYNFPQGYKLIIANSFVKANKTTNAKDAFNSRVAAYEFGLMIFKDKFPQYSGAVGHIRDINAAKLGLPPGGIYRLLLELPEKVKPEELFEFISAGNHAKIKNILASHTSPAFYNIRAVVLYGVAECCRADLCKGLFDAKKITEFGQMMNISHNGDRVISYDEKGGSKGYDSNVPDAKLRELAADLAGGDPEKVSAAKIENQPGGYACSTPEIDFLVDTALRVKGVLGAQISGAGLGGCVMVLVEDQAAAELVKKLENAYYKPRGLESGLTVCVPVEGSGVLKLR